MVLPHGVPETGAAWDAVAADLAVDHRVVVPDLRGAGRSSFAPTLPDLTADTVLGLAPRRRVVVVPRAGHFLPTERPRETAEAIRDLERG